MKIRHLLTIAAASAGVSLAPAIADAAPARRPVPVKTACFYGSVTGPACDGFPTPANDYDGRVTPPRWDPCLPGGSTLLYVSPCGRYSVSVATWCALHFDHHTGVFGDWCDD